MIEYFWYLAETILRVAMTAPLDVWIDGAWLTSLLLAAIVMAILGVRRRIAD